MVVGEEAEKSEVSRLKAGGYGRPGVTCTRAVQYARLAQKLSRYGAVSELCKKDEKSGG